MTPIFVFGTGAWGTALSLSSLKTGHPVTLIARRPEFAKDLLELRKNQVYLPNIALPKDLKITSDLTILNVPGILLLASPAQATHETITSLKSFLCPETIVVICAKGIDQKRLCFPSDIAQELIPNPIAVLSGPSFADEVANNLPTAVTLAADSLEIAQNLCQHLRHPHLRCYASDDKAGVQIAGAIKNVLAIACGIVQGKNMGNNAAAALLTRGLAEMRRLGMAMGAKSETFLGLSGVGDLSLTGASEQSRNYSLGLALGQGNPLTEILQHRRGVTEGVATAAALIHLADRHHVRMPICHGVYQVLHEGKNLNKTIEEMLSSQSTLEF